MRELKVDKKELGQQLWPISFEGILIFNDSFFGTEGFFGVRENSLIFIPQENIPNKMTVYIPENLEEVQGFLASAEYILQRTMMTPGLEVQGWSDSSTNIEDLHKEVIATFSDFIRMYAKNANEYERINLR